jgi:hypothetical protein
MSNIILNVTQSTLLQSANQVIQVHRRGTDN